MPKARGPSRNPNSTGTMECLRRFFRPDADPWECLGIEIAPQVFGRACNRNFAEYLDGPAQVATRNLEELCTWLRQCRTVEDTTLFFAPDFWQHPVTFEQVRQGDCEDHALWAWRQLARLGIPARFVVGLWRNTPHAWVLVDPGPNELVLETTAKSGPMLLPTPAARTDYFPAAGVDHQLQTYVYQGYARFHDAASSGTPPGPRASTGSDPGPPAPNDFEIAILAGGRSSRMGRDKAAVKIEGRSLLGHIRATARTLGRPVRVIRRDQTPGCGPIGGVATALATTKAGIVLFLSCDMPAVTGALLQRVLKAFRKSTRAVFTTHEGRAGFPFAVRSEARAVPEAQLRAGRFSLQQLARELQARHLTLPKRDLPQLVNLNTPDDLAAYRASRSQETQPQPGSAPAKSGQTSTPRRSIRAALKAWIALASLILAGSAAAPINAATPSLEHWAPDQTLAYITVPNASLARAEANRHGPGRLWADPAMLPLRNHFQQSLETRLLAPLQSLCGWHAGRLLSLAQGQISLVLLDDAQRSATGVAPDWLLVLDAGQHTNELAAQLAAAKTPTTTNSPTKISALRLHGIEFARVQIPGADLDRVLDKAFPRTESNPAKPGSAAPATELFFGLAGSCLVASTTTNVIHGVLDRLAGTAPREMRVPAFASASPPDSQPLLRAWVNGPPAVARLVRSFGGAGSGAAAAGFSAFSSDRVAFALGLKQLEAASFAIHSTAEGWLTEIRLAVPTTARRGLLKLLQPLPADASPPPWVPADILSFARYRIAGPSGWNSFQRLLQDIDPALLGVVQLLTEYAGRTEDVNFNFDHGLIAKLGDDWIATSRQVADTNVFGADLIAHGTTNALAVHHALTLIASPAYLATFLPPGAPPPPRREREIAGSRVVSVGLPPFPWQEGPQRMLHLARRDNLVALAGTERTIENFLTLTNPATPLAASPEFSRALARAGGPAGGWVAYSHEREVARHAFDLLTRSRSPLEDVLHWAAFSEITTRAAAALLTWVRLDLLPPYDRVSPYFHFRVESGRSSSDGLQLTTFRPTSVPPPAPPLPALPP